MKDKMRKRWLLDAHVVLFPNRKNRPLCAPTGVIFILSLCELALVTVIFESQ